MCWNVNSKKVLNIVPKTAKRDIRVVKLLHKDYSPMYYFRDEKYDEIGKTYYAKNRKSANGKYNKIRKL